ncbi:hypothetical protein ALI144C_44770 [Actinosynnema sp. ALI-1.44]|uniref:hypothetical protein n=1 Tax=Actinosynnema sp. ALI-1.44 TaxID=1933779 RepID=UPI00097BFC4F|nr:hypothetical protein [Actinosynnema sp. ALI-1.44]ONI73068.1 hypothetical protein ALI144C_44770 [Actinosynnema sp. ALI-1.44]
MIASLIALGVLIGWIPAVWIAQAVYDWWTKPERVFLRKIWRADRAEQLRHLFWGSADVAASCVEPPPAPGAAPPGAGPTPRSTAVRPRCAPSPSGGGSGHNPVGVGDPDNPAPTGDAVAVASPPVAATAKGAAA